MSVSELPMCCRTCAHKKTTYQYPHWSHQCLRTKPMVDGCQWKVTRNLTEREIRNERQDY